MTPQAIGVYSERLGEDSTFSTRVTRRERDRLWSGIEVVVYRDGAASWCKVVSANDDSPEVVFRKQDRDVNPELVLSIDDGKTARLARVKEFLF